MSSTILIPDLPATEKNRLEKRLRLFYNTYNPENIDVVPKALCMQITEKDIFNKLYAKYNVAEIEERERAGNNDCLPPQIQEAQILTNTEETGPNADVCDYPQAEKDRLLKRLTNFYKKYAPKNVSNVANAIKVPKTEDDLMHLVCSKYRVFVLQEMKEASDAEVLPPWTDPELIQANPLTRYTVIGVCPRTKVPFISLPKNIISKLGNVLGDAPAVHHFVEVDNVAQSKDGIDTTNTPVFLVIHSTGITTFDRDTGKIRRFTRFESFENILKFQGGDASLAITVNRGEARGNIALDNALNVMIDCKSDSVRSTIIDTLNYLVNYNRSFGKRVLIQHCEPTSTMVHDVVSAKLELTEAEAEQQTVEEAEEEAAAHTENVANVANIPDREDGPLLCDFDGEDKLRVATRLYLFYRNHVGNDRSMFAKIPNAMALKACERYVFYVLTSKYNVRPSQERREAYEADLISEEEINLSASGTFSPLMAGESQGTFESNNDGSGAPASPASLAGTSRSRRSKRGSKKVTLPNEVRQALTNDKYHLQSNKDGQVVIVVPKNDRKNITNLPPAEKERVRARLRHFYKTFASFVDDVEARIDGAMKRLAVNEKIVFDIVCRKYLVDPVLEMTEARAAKLLPASEMKKDIHGDRIVDELDGSVNSSNNNASSGNDLFDDDYLYANDPMNAVGLSYAKKNNNNNNADPSSPLSKGGDNSNVSCSSCASKDAEIQELKRQLEEMTLEKEFLALELDTAKEALGELA